MKALKSPIPKFLMLILIIMGCEQEEFIIECDSSSGVKTKFTGKIYSNDPFTNNYYIGAIDHSKGGRIPCNGLPKNFQKEGLIVEVEGITAGSPTDDFGDPAFGYIEITNIKESTEHN